MNPRAEKRLLTQGPPQNLECLALNDAHESAWNFNKEIANLLPRAHMKLGVWIQNGAFRAHKKA
jgi:hypothetical protein